MNNQSKKYYLISGLDLNDNNRGTAALGYGAFPFLNEFHGAEKLAPIQIKIFKNPLKLRHIKPKTETYIVGKHNIQLNTFYISFLDLLIFKNVSFLSKYTKTHTILEKLAFVAAINGGDGFSDIYGTKTFEQRLFHINLAIENKIPLIILPQTLGPFKEEYNINRAKRILEYATKIYVRDEQFVEILKNWKLNYELTKDLSWYMKPEHCDIKIKNGAIGINISGLCYSNQFRDLTGKFSTYPLLISKILERFQKKNITIYLISHSYNYTKPEIGNDDLFYSKKFFAELENKNNVHLINQDLNSPQTKFIISKLDFLVGTRMHACFAAIFTNTPVFGLAYSYKYEGSFKYMGQGKNYVSIVNVDPKEIPLIVDRIEEYYFNQIKKLD
jgi:polysaccharide pyruvyl transferase WcaK-like protein